MLYSFHSHTAAALTDYDREIITQLSSSIPVIPFCTTSLSSVLTGFGAASPRLASFQPHTQLSLRMGLFRAPQTIATLRAEAADRFMRWREVERTLEDHQNYAAFGDGDKSKLMQQYIPPIHRRGTVTQYSIDVEKWNKATWEAMLSEDVARRLRETKSLHKSTSVSESGSLANSVLFTGAPCFAPALDPLHFRSLMVLSLSLFAPRRCLAATKPKLKTVDGTMDSTRSTLRASSPGPRFKRKQMAGEATKDNNNKCRTWRWSWGFGLALLCTGVGVGIGCMLSAIARA